jgi:lysozyme family protein
MTPTLDSIIDGVIARELHQSERGKPWADVRAREHPADRGGLTKAGITVTTLGEWRQLGRRATRVELESMTEDECRAIYRARYARPFEGIPEPLRSLMVDWAVTSGHDDPTKALQASLRSRGVYGGAVDGIFGAKTRAALLRDQHQRETYQDVFKARIAFYRDLALRDPEVRTFLETHPRTQLHFLAGWQNRALEFALS